MTLIGAAKEHGIEFIYAISPGLDITFSNQKEVSTLKRKLDQARKCTLQHNICMHACECARPLNCAMPIQIQLQKKTKGSSSEVQKRKRTKTKIVAQKCRMEMYRNKQPRGAEATYKN